jgi:salicylate hydroxylase
MRKPKVGIVGGGIGGLALAGCLAQRNIEFRVFERANAFSAIGAGIQMTPNGVKVMKALGKLDDMLRVGFLPHALVGRNWRSGRQNFRTPLKDVCEELYDAPFIHIHRADLHDVLVTLVPDGMAEFGAECTGVRQEKDTAVATFRDGREFEADLIVGADGVRSAVRNSLFGAEAPRFTGHMCYRAVVPVGGLVDYVSPDTSFWLGPNGHVVTYYVNGGKAVNIVAVAESSWVEESWNVVSNREEMRSTYKGWHRNLDRLFDDAEEVYKWGLFDRDPMTTWSRGNVTLLGDAAHPMLPFLSQGAAISIEDTYVLAASLDAHGLDIASALRDYERERIPRASRVQLEARERGRTYHLPSRLAQMKRDVTFWLRSLINPQSSGIRANWVYEYDARKFQPSRSADAASLVA